MVRVVLFLYRALLHLRTGGSSFYIGEFLRRDHLTLFESGLLVNP